MIRIISNEKRYDQIFIRYLGKDYPIKYGSKIYVANAELTNIDLRFFTNGYNLEYACDSTDIPNTMQDVFGKDRVKAWLDLDMDFQSEMKRLFGTPRLAFGIIDKLNNVIYPSPNPTGDSYNSLSDKPRVNGVALYGDKSSEQLGLVSTEKYSELLTKVDDTLSTAHATVNFVQTHCVEKSSTKLLSDKDRKLLNDILTSLTAGEDNYVIDNETLKSVLELYPTKISLIDTLSAYTLKSDYIQKLASVDAKLIEIDSTLNAHAKNMQTCLSRANWETFSDDFVKTVNGRHLDSDNNLVLDAGDIPVTAGDEGNVRGRLGELEAGINANKDAITKLTAAEEYNANSITNIINGASTVYKAYRDKNGDLIDQKYVTVDAYTTEMNKLNGTFTDIRNSINTKAAEAESKYLQQKNLSEYVTKKDAEAYLTSADAMVTYANKTNTDNALNNLSNQVSARYTKTEADYKFVAKEAGKGLSERNYTQDDVTLLERAADNAESALSKITSLCKVMDATTKAIQEINKCSGLVENLCTKYPGLFKGKVYLYNAIDGIYDEYAYVFDKDHPIDVLGYLQYCLKTTEDTLYVKKSSGFKSADSYISYPNGYVDSYVCKEISSMISSNSGIDSYFYFDEGNHRFVIKITGENNDGYKMAKVVCVLPIPNK